MRPHAFKRSIANLIENAIRYAEHVTVRIGQRRHSIEIIIDDDGPGIPEELREDAFKPFYRLEDSRNPETGGVGLGLSIARDIIRGHGGEIFLGNSPSMHPKLVRKSKRFQKLTILPFCHHSIRQGVTCNN